MGYIDYSKYFSIDDYYKKVVMPINSRFRYVKNGKYICCLHGDTDPSMGVIYSKKKGEIFHCFGCNAWGNIVDLHMKVSRIYFKKNLDYEEARRDLCRIFNIDYARLPSEEDGSVKSKNKDVSKELAMREAMGNFDISDLKEGILVGKIEGKSIAYFNSLVIRMIDSSSRKEK